MTLNVVLAQAAARLRGAGVTDPARDARVLLAHAIGIERSQLAALGLDALPDAALQAFEQAISAREARQPVSQIIGRREFFGRTFQVTSQVLDPRPDTEKLIETALNHPFSNLLDLGTGSGCIVLSLLAERAQARGVGVDISAPALAVAAQNARNLGVAERVEFHTSDWFGSVQGQFDLIVSNPPYISADEMADLQPEVRNWEPSLALSPGGDGLQAYRVLARDAGPFLKPGGRVIMEIGPSQADAVIGLLNDAGFADCRVHRDLDQRDRVIEVRQNG